MATDTKALREALAKGEAWIGQTARLTHPDGWSVVGQSQDVATLRDLLDEVEALRSQVESQRPLVEAAREWQRASMDDDWGNRGNAIDALLLAAEGKV